MEEYHQITITEYLTWKQEIKDRLNTTVDNFIVIGYRLKQIRDSEAYRNDGYPSMGAFVQEEYGLNEATASKFIKINDNYSEGGNSMRLQEKYQGYGYNKLYEMIALPESDRALITADTSVKEIREIKQFNKEAEQKPAADADEEKLLKMLLTDNQEAFNWIMSGQEKEHMEDILYAFAPSGSRMIRQGTLMLFLQSEQEGVKIKRFGAGQQQLSYAEFFERIRELFIGRESEMFPEKEEKIKETKNSLEKLNVPITPAKFMETLKEERETEAIAETLDINYEEKTPPTPEELKEKYPEVIEMASAVVDEIVTASNKEESFDVEKEQKNDTESDENVIEEPENVIETSGSVPEFPINVPENTDSVPETVEQPAEKTMFRYEYILDLTPSGMASYLYKNLPRTALSAPNAKMMKSWISEMVDEKGRTYSS